MSKYSENMPPSLKGAIEWMYDHIAPNSTLLDFGCSTGYFGAYIKEQKQCVVYGAEISDDRFEAEKVLDGVYTFDLDGEWPKELYERTYDYLFFGDVIEHVKDPRLVLEKCQKLLKPKGKIFISTPNIAHISTRLELMSGNFEYEPMGILDETHLKYFTKSSLQKIVTNAGYQIDLIDYTANDYPKEIIQKYLKKLGLVAEKKFWDMTKSPEARAFQYKLMISRSSNKTQNQAVRVNPPQKPEQYRDDLLADLNNQIKAIKRHADEQAKIIEHLSNESNIQKLRADRLQRKVDASISGKIKKRLKRA